MTVCVIEVLFGEHYKPKFSKNLDSNHSNSEMVEKTLQLYKIKTLHLTQYLCCLTPCDHYSATLEAYTFLKPTIGELMSLNIHFSLI